MTEISSSEFTKTPGRFFERVARGETIMLTRYDRPYVLLSPPPQAEEQPKEELRQAG